MGDAGQFGGQKRGGSECSAKTLTHEETRQVWEIIQITGVNKAPAGVGRVMSKSHVTSLSLVGPSVKWD